MMDRRTFLKIFGIGVGAVASGVGVGDILPPEVAPISNKFTREAVSASHAPGKPTNGIISWSISVNSPQTVEISASPTKFMQYHDFPYGYLGETTADIVCCDLDLMQSLLKDYEGNRICDLVLPFRLGEGSVSLSGKITSYEMTREVGTNAYCTVSMTVLSKPMLHP